MGGNKSPENGKEMPDAIHLCLTHIKSVACPPPEDATPLIWAQNNKGEDERQRASVLVRLCEGAIKKEKYTKAINNLRALLLLTEDPAVKGESGTSFMGQSQVEASQELTITRAMLTSLSIRLIANLMALEGREPPETARAYLRSDDCITESMRVQFSPQVRRALKIDLALPKRRGGFGALTHLYGEELPTQVKAAGLTWPPPPPPPPPAPAPPPAPPQQAP